MSTGTAVPAVAGAAVTSARSPGNAPRLVVGVKDREFPLDLFTAALLTFQRSVFLAHGTDNFEFLLARFADIFIDGHEVHLVSKEI
jgi:hypothetical protein